MEITTESPLLPWLVRQCDEPGGLLEPAQEELVQIQRRRSRTSSRSRVSETGAATACEPELLTIHITDNHTKSLEHCKHCKEEASPLQKYGSSRSKQRAWHESCRTSTNQVF